MRDAEMLSVVLREGATFAALGAAVSMMWQTNAEFDFYILPLFFFFFWQKKISSSDFCQSMKNRY